VKKTHYSKLKLGAAPLVLSVALVSAPAFAQDAEEGATGSSEIVVTGTLIRNPNLEQSTPVNVTTADTIELKQSNVAEEVLRELPGVVANIGSAVNNGNGGASYVDLRGLGSIRNIVLINGNRVAPSDVNGRVDLNNIPLALIERVDALTGAADHRRRQLRHQARFRGSGSHGVEPDHRTWRRPHLPRRRDDRRQF
jgi:iron complex outermembrane recepter protein